MKTSKPLLVLTILLLLTFTSCRKKPSWPVNGKGSSVEQTRSISNFDRIHLSTDAELEYVQDSVYSVVISAQQNILNILETKTNGSTLQIDLDKTAYNYNKVKIYVHSPNIYNFTISGSGNIKCPGNINTNNLELNISGSGNLSVNSLTTQSLQSKISGSGNVTVSGGLITNQNVSISGSGNINTVDAKSNVCTAKISGSGDITAWVTESLDVNISGSGSMKYKGTPAVNTQISGAGKLIHIN